MAPYVNNLLLCRFLMIWMHPTNTCPWHWIGMPSINVDITFNNILNDDFSGYSYNSFKSIILCSITVYRICYCKFRTEYSYSTIVHNYCIYLLSTIITKLLTPQCREYWYRKFDKLSLLNWKNTFYSSDSTRCNDYLTSSVTVGTNVLMYPMGGDAPTR